MLTSVIVGASGARARGHAEAYAHVTKVRLVAISSRDRQALDAFGARYQVADRYTDYRDMLAAVRPDLVHVNTPPTVRLEVLEAARDAGVQGVLVEKPIAVQGEDWLALRRFADASPSLRVAVNHQLHYHPRRQILQGWLTDGRIGALRFVEGSAGHNMAYQGTHTLEGICALAAPRGPRKVLAQVAGAEGLRPSTGQHLAPDDCIAAVLFDDDLRGLLHVGRTAPVAAGAPSPAELWMHKRLAAYGERGWLEWTMWGWKANLDGVLLRGSHDYWHEDLLGQAALTDSIADWVESGSSDHPTSLQRSLAQFSVVLGAYQSALDHTAVTLPFTPAPHLMDSLRERLT